MFSPQGWTFPFLLTSKAPIAVPGIHLMNVCSDNLTDRLLSLASPGLALSPGSWSGIAIRHSPHTLRASANLGTSVFPLAPLTYPAMLLWVEFHHPQRQPEVLTPSISEYDLFQDRVLTEEIKLHSLGEALIQYGWRLYKKGEIWVQRQTCTQGHSPVKTAVTLPQTKELSEGRRGARTFPRAFRGSRPCRHIDRGLLASIAERQYTCVV